MPRTRAATAIRIHCPVARETIAALLAGDDAAIERDPVLTRILAVIRGDGPLGNFGLYHGVAELAPGWECFRPAAGAAPTLGSPGADSRSPTVTLTTYAPDGADLAAALDALMAAHPWEVPVIEVYPTTLLVRS